MKYSDPANNEKLRKAPGHGIFNRKERTVGACRKDRTAGILPAPNNNKAGKDAGDTLD
jgi:hypothetical protein